MNKASPLFFCGMLLASRADAAISILIEPDGTGATVFTINQTSPNPLLNVAGITGYALGIDLPLSMFNISSPVQSSAISGNFATPLGNATESYGGQRFSIAGLHIDEITAYLAFSPIFILSSQSSAQFVVEAPLPVTTTLSPDALNAGTHSVNSVLFGTVTVTVVPEPSTLTLTAAIAPALLWRRRKP